MLIGVVSDTHNNVSNIENIITIFNNQKVDLVIHTGDISNAKTLRMFSKLNCQMLGVFGNNDRKENGLIEACNELEFDFREPPLFKSISKRKIAIFHEPELIHDYLKEHPDIDLILHGHTHRYREEIIDNVLYFNPGESAGLVKGKNALGIVELRSLRIKRIFF